MLRGMAPELQPGAYAFRTALDEAEALAAWPRALAMFREAEGVSLVEAVPEDSPLAMAWITLTVASALDGVGLTAAVASVLAAAAIPCNMVAAHHHDHVFVPVAQAERALALLQRLSEEADPED